MVRNHHPYKVFVGIRRGRDRRHGLMQAMHGCAKRGGGMGRARTRSVGRTSTRGRVFLLHSSSQSRRNRGRNRGSVSCGDATGYELYVIASAVVGGARLSGGRGSAVSAMLGAVLIVLIRQSIRTLHLDQNYEWIIIGCAIIIAVVLDQTSARLTRRTT